MNLLKYILLKQLVNEKTASIFPETNDEIDTVDCKHCLKKLNIGS